MKVSAEQALAALLECKEVFVTCEMVAPLLHVSGNSLHVAAMDDQARARLGFPVTVMGMSTVRIPRIPLLDFLGVRRQEDW